MPARQFALALIIGLMCSFQTSMVYSQDDAAAVVVTTRSLSELMIQLEREAAAQVLALEDSQISAQLNATIQELAVEVGAKVAQDALLAQLDCADYELVLQELTARQQALQARLDFSERQLERARALQQQRTVSQELAEQRLSERNTLRAERISNAAALGRAERNRALCQIKAPFAGTVIERLVDVGEYVTPGTPLFRLLADQRTELSAQIPLAELTSLNTAENIWLRTVIGNYALQLRSLLPIVDAMAQTREARLTFTAFSPAAGTKGRLVWLTEPHLPASVLLERKQQLGVLLAVDGKAVFQPLPKAQEGRPAPIPVELTPQSLIITDGRQGLQHGDPIMLQPEASESTDFDLDPAAINSE